MVSEDLSANDFMARTSDLLNRQSAEHMPMTPAPTGGSLAARSDELLARTAALLGKPIPTTPMPADTSMPVAESSLYAPETPSPAPTGSFAQRSSDLLARTAQLLGKPIAADSPGAAPVDYAMSSPPPPASSFAPPAYTPPPMPAAPAAEGSFAQRSADLLARTAQLLGKPTGDGGAAAAPMMASPPPMMASPPPMMFTPPPAMPMPAGPPPQGGSFNQRADDLLARTAALLGGAPAPPAAAPSPLPVALPPSVEHAMQGAGPGSGSATGSFAQRSDDLLARTAALLGKPPSASFDAGAAPAPYPVAAPAPYPVSLPPSVEHSLQAAAPGSGSFAQRSDELLARTAALLGKAPAASPAFDVSATTAPQIPPPTTYEQPHAIATPFMVQEAAPPMPPPAPAGGGGGGGNFAQRSADVLARTAQLLNKSADPAPELELLKMLRQAPPVGGK